MSNRRSQLAAFSSLIAERIDARDSRLIPNLNVVAIIIVVVVIIRVSTLIGLAGPT